MGQNIFNTVQVTAPDTNVFDLSYDMKLSLDMGKLVPVHCQEIAPADRISITTESLLRFAPLIAPVMHKVDVTVHFFFVPNRITWSGWEDFITNKPSSPALPYLADIPVSNGDLADYLGLPLGANIDKVSALPFAAYQRVYNEYYRDQNLQDEVAGTELTDGLNSTYKTALLTLRRRAWGHDYFTSALPFAQKGEAIDIPLAPFPDLDVLRQASLGGAMFRNRLGGEIDTGDLNLQNIPSSPNSFIYDATGNQLDFDPNGSLVVKTSELSAVPTTINDLRTAFAMQRYLEKNARGGTRYSEWIRTHFNKRTSDSRLNRPEYLGGVKQPMVISEVLQTSNTNEASPQANMAGHGISVGSGKAFSYTAEEHGYIIGILSVMPQTAYQQGIPKHFSKFDVYDYLIPSLAHLGEQAILNREIYYDHDDTPENNDATFGYIPRYAEYRFHENRVAGDFRDSLSFWHLGRIFSERPNLNSSFIQANPARRIFAVTDEQVHTIYAHVFHRIKAVRTLPKYGTPI